ncbi:hypothetical protein BP5796_12721 [Coleophoma crateriformis]|uniref:NAD-dependent epimerase/dehydratase domain-containing protein n=1 Tax=Coleophoma crateriformis TaxID=565419 RepID=A0A3D8Q634_9HELO|nr:hypothetical protein BP5796_12721 [Coleophoma crateriformis]
MAEPAARIPKGSWILITGVNGFVAAHLAKQLLQRGYKIRGTVRDLEKSSWLINDVFQSSADDGNFELVQVPDLGAEGAFDDAVKGMSAAAHVASIGTFDADPYKVIPQTVMGAISILQAALREPMMKAFVYTSSIVATTLVIPDIHTRVERDTWNEDAINMAWAPPPYEPARGPVVYAASKTEAEKAVWKFAEEKNPHFSINSICPATIIGEPLGKKHVETPYAFLKLLYDGNTDFLIANPEIIHIDVKDVGLLHVAALLDPELQDARLPAWAEYCNWNDVLAIMRRLYPQRKFIDDLPPSTPITITTDCSQPLALLKKWGNQDGWTSLEESVADNMTNLVAWYP